MLAALAACVFLWRARERDLERHAKAIAESIAREEKATAARVSDAQSMTASLLQQLREGNAANNTLAQANCDLTDEIRRTLERIDRDRRTP